ncbi:MAG: putative porin [Halioglobus sp.]|nr:putative porin [Halioglobus sp.]
MKKILLTAAMYPLLLSSPASAQVSQAEWEEMKAQFAAMSARMNALEKENRQLRDARSLPVEDLEAARVEVDTLKAQNAASSWAERIKWKGDFRYRFEDIEEEGRDDRDRNRIRARPALVAKVTETAEVGFGMATGGDDPVSTNQTLGGGGTTKDVRLDLAYATWTGLENTAITLGKFANPFYRVNKSGLIWDSDYRPEGASVRWGTDLLFANAVFNFIESDSRNDEDSIWGVQLGATFDPLDFAKLTASAAYLDIPTKGRISIYDDDFFGNSTVQVDGEEVYEFDYNLITGSLELVFDVFELPLSVYADYVKNDDADDYDTGYLAGIQLGKAKKRGSWQLQYQYEKLEADATLGLVTDSDFAGGGTDGKGHRVKAKYAIDNNWTVGATYFDNVKDFDRGENIDYERLQVDTVFKY